MTVLAVSVRERSKRKISSKLKITNLLNISSSSRHFVATAKIMYGASENKDINAKFVVLSFTKGAMNSSHLFAQEWTKICAKWGSAIAPMLLATIDLVIHLNCIHIQAQHFVTTADLFFTVLYIKA